MAAGPPNDDIADGPEAVDFGIAALAAHVDGAELSFPATADEVVATLDDPEIDFDPTGNTVALSVVLERVDRREFESRRELLDALHPEFERLRRSSGGFLSWVRGLFK